MLESCLQSRQSRIIDKEITQTDIVYFTINEYQNFFYGSLNLRITIGESFTLNTICTQLPKIVLSHR